MKQRLYVLIGAVCVGLLALLGVARITNAYSIHSGDNVSISQKGSINDTIYAAGQTVDISNEVFGDVFCVGQSVTVSGTIHGDVICAGQTINVSGTVDGDVRLAGQSITLSAKVGGNATVGGQSFSLPSSASIGGDLTIGSQNATISGPIGRDIVMGSANARISNMVGRNIKAQSEHLTLASGAKVGGNVENTSQNNVRIDNQAVVSGKVTRIEPEHTQGKSHSGLTGFKLLWLLYWLIAMVFTAFILILLFPRLFHAVTNQAMPRPWKALLVGFLATIVMPIVIVLLAGSLIGIPLAVILGFIWLVCLLLSSPLFGYYVGRLVLRNSKRPLLIMLAGAAILAIVIMIPFLGFIALLATIWIGTGMLLLEVTRRTPKPQYSLVDTTKNPMRFK